MITRLFITSIFILVTINTYSQDLRPLEINEDSKYYNFWLGKWYVQNEDLSIDSLSYFVVKQGVHAANFIEEWNFKGMGKSLAIRAWDKTNNKWGFVWVSENGLYQVWDSKKEADNWYIHNKFTINGESYFSRQGFFLQANGTVLRISEKSSDEIHWELRFKQILVKAK